MSGPDRDDVPGPTINFCIGTDGKDAGSFGLWVRDGNGWRLVQTGNDSWLDAMREEVSRQCAQHDWDEE